MILRYRKPHKCSDCRFCDAKEMVCYPESEDCMPYYDLDEVDLNTEGFCDFFQPILQNENKIVT